MMEMRWRRKLLVAGLVMAALTGAMFFLMTVGKTSEAESRAKLVRKGMSRTHVAEILGNPAPGGWQRFSYVKPHEGVAFADGSYLLVYYRQTDGESSVSEVI